LGRQSASALAWEFPERMRPALQPWLAAVAIRLHHLVGITSPFTIAFTLRLASTILAAVATLEVCVRCLRPVSSETLRRSALFIAFLLWLAPLVHGRFSSENWGGTWLAFGVCCAIDAAGAQQLRDALERQADFDAALRCRRRDGSLFWAQLTLAPVRFGNAPTHFVAVVTDLTEQRRQEAEVSYLARHDAVTGLARFDGAESSIQPLLDALGANDRLAVFQINLDRFQAVNDSLGYRGGNEMLHLIGQRLRYVAGDHGLLWRAGGDEFVLARRCEGPEDDPMRVAESIREWIEVPVELPGGTVHLSASVGIAVHPQHASVAVDLVQCADAALRRAKQSGRNSALSFAEGHMDEVRDRIALHGRLRHAIARNELLFHFQPQVRASDGYIVGMEALLRWATPDLGLLGPARFVPLAEDLGMIVEIGQWALREACRRAIVDTFTTGGAQSKRPEGLMKRLAEITDLPRYMFKVRSFENDQPIVRTVKCDPPITRRGDEANPTKLIKASLQRWGTKRKAVEVKIMKFLAS